jgi:hypothetical protein
MKPEQIVGLIVRCFAVYVFFSMTLSPAMMLMHMLGAASAEYPIVSSVVLSYVAMITVGVIVPLLLWLFPLTLARKLIPTVDSTTVKTGLSFEQLEFLSFSILGVWLVTTAMGYFFHSLITTFGTLYNENAMPGQNLRNAAGFFILQNSYTVVYATIGLLLLLKPQRVSRFLRKMRGGID